MTNYHTVVPGTQNSGDQTQLNQQGGATKFGGQNEYKQREFENSGGTRISGMEINSSSGSLKQEMSIGKPIVGFLVSVSRVEEGEYWVLRQGQNTIGSGSNCNVILSESSVSGIHAILAVHRNPGDNNRLSVGLIDRGSSNGTFVNENYIGFNPVQCKNLDKIKIGNYELLLLLFDPINFGMAKAENFIAKDSFDYADRDNYQPNDYSTRL